MSSVFLPDRGAGLVAGYRKRDWAAVASARTIKASQNPDLLTVAGDIADPGTAAAVRRSRSPSWAGRVVPGLQADGSMLWLSRKMLFGS